MPSCETCYHGGPLENICIAVILQSLLYNYYIIVVKSVWYSCVSSVCCNYMCNFMWGCYKMHYRTLRGRDQRKKCTLNFIKYTLSRPTTKSALLHRKECFIRSIKYSRSAGEFFFGAHFGLRKFSRNIFFRIMLCT